MRKGGFFMSVKDLTGEKIGRLIVIERIKNKGDYVFWKCRCSCGNFVEVSSNNLRSKHTKSCGCLSRELAAKRLTTHGMKKTRLYNIWTNMNRRCKTATDYTRKGIKVCSLWEHDFNAFYKWATANGYKDGLTIDRIDYNGNYTPVNCRWATLRQQNNNRSNNRLLAYKGETKPLSIWADIVGINRRTLYTRIYNLHWDVDKALGSPVLYR